MPPLVLGNVSRRDDSHRRFPRLSRGDRTGSADLSLWRRCHFRYVLDWRTVSTDGRTDRLHRRRRVDRRRRRSRTRHQRKLTPSEGAKVVEMLNLNVAVASHYLGINDEVEEFISLVSTKTTAIPLAPKVGESFVTDGRRADIE